MSEYEDGLREGRLASLEKVTKELTTDLKQIKAAIWMLYGALAFIGIFPEIKVLFQ